MEETSLSDFVGEGDDEAGADGPGADRTGQSPGTDIDDPATSQAAGSDEPDRPTVTAAWMPEGGACARCGESAGWRWTDGDRRVCRDCKDW
jgi:hypothetical protein